MIIASKLTEGKTEAQFGANCLSLCKHLSDQVRIHGRPGSGTSEPELCVMADFKMALWVD